MNRVGTWEMQTRWNSGPFTLMWFKSPDASIASVLSAPPCKHLIAVFGFPLLASALRTCSTASVLSFDASFYLFFFYSPSHGLRIPLVISGSGGFKLQVGSIKNMQRMRKTKGWKMVLWGSEA